MIRVITVDDEPLAHEVLENFIFQTKQIILIKKCYNALEAFNILHTEKIDLMFLDIKMPSINGIDFIKSLKDPPSIIFTTAYSEYAITGFELEAIDYLLKPITYGRFQKSIDKLLRLQQHEQTETKNYTYFKVSGKLIKIFHSDILFVQSVKDYIHIKTIKGNYLTHMTMKYLAELLKSPLFIRVHRSYLVNKEYINLVSKFQLNIGKEKIPIGESYRANFKAIISNHL